MTAQEVLRSYYSLRKEFRRPMPDRLGRERSEADLSAMREFTSWCAQHDVTDPVAFMRERFRSIYTASRRRSVPRISQLANDKAAERWVDWLEGEKIEAQSYRERLYREDQTGDLIKTLAAPPHRGHESVKRRLKGGEPCLELFEHTGGYHPSSPWCVQCECSAKCIDRLRSTYGFDVPALRRGDLSCVPSSVACALLR